MKAKLDELGKVIHEWLKDMKKFLKEQNDWVIQVLEDSHKLSSKRMDDW